MDSGKFLIWNERLKQIDKWSKFHDKDHVKGELAIVAASCMVDGIDAEIINKQCVSPSWGLIKKYGYRGSKPDHIKLLTIAGALIAAEIDRIQAIGRGD